MKKNKVIIILSVSFLFTIFFVACESNKPLPNKKEISQEKIKQPANESKDSQQQGKPNTQTQPKPDSRQDSKSDTQKDTAKKPPIKKETKKELMIASFSTTILDGEKNRVNNIRIASKKINNYIIKPGEVFSFNGVVGKREYFKGYKDARVLVNGKVYVTVLQAE